MDAKALETTTFVELRFVHVNKYTGTSKNETVTFEKVTNGNSFIVTSGATGLKRGPKKARTEEYELKEWNNQLARYIKKGFDPVSTEKIETVEIKTDSIYVKLNDETFQSFIEMLIAANDEVIEEVFGGVKKLRNIPKEHMAHAQDALIDMSKNKDTLSVSEFNEMLMKDIFTYIPRPMNNIKNKLAAKREQFEDIITREQEYLDNVQQLLKTKVIEGKNQTILEANGLKGRAATDDEITYLKGLMTDKSNHFVRAWKVSNTETEKAFNDYCKEQGLTEENGINHLFHGTGVENVWSIYKNGLYLNPAVIKSNVRICGKAFGYGLYFAPYCYKSMGYASTSAAIHYSGHNNDNRTGYLLVFKVATGKPYYIYSDPTGCHRPNHWADFHEDHPGMHCCWAEAGRTGSNGLNRLAMDEVIVYQEKQATIEYIIEFEV